MTIGTAEESNMATGTTSIRLPEEVLRALDALASVTARNRNYLITEAVKEFVARETWHVQRIQEGLRQAEAGEFVPEAEMEAFWASWTTPETLAEARAAVQDEVAAHTKA
jgi:predicted transcriptional regulator